MAWMPASMTGCGVSKSGSPAARLMTSWPASLMLLAKSVRAMVLDICRPATRGFSLMSTGAPAADILVGCAVQSNTGGSDSALLLSVETGRLVRMWVQVAPLLCPVNALPHEGLVG